MKDLIFKGNQHRIRSLKLLRIMFDIDIHILKHDVWMWAVGA